MQLQLTNYTPATDEYEFKAYEDDTHVATLWVAHRSDQTDIVVEMGQHSGVHNTAEERVEFLLQNAIEIHRAIKNAMED